MSREASELPLAQCPFTEGKCMGNKCMLWRRHIEVNERSHRVWWDCALSAGLTREGNCPTCDTCPIGGAGCADGNGVTAVPVTEQEQGQEICPDCGGVGYITTPTHSPDCDGSCLMGHCPVPVQTQCKRCEGTNGVQEQSRPKYRVQDGCWNCKHHEADYWCAVRQADIDIEMRGICSVWVKEEGR